MLVLDRIHYRYDRQLVLNGVSLTLAPGKILCLTGPSGCGKTTVMKIAAGSLRPNSGVANNRFARTACVF
ncbi:MAG: ATP-binding cassette domain-containing protein, partial [Xenococcus sp. (in: cyanobacteria)]